MKVDVYNIQLTELIAFVHNSLPKIDNTTYKIELIQKYPDDLLSSDIKCEVTMLKTISSDIVIPIASYDISKMKMYIGLLIDDLTEKITGIPSEKNYIELNGVKYYPKNESE